MDKRLRSLYREFGGNDHRFLEACVRAGQIPLGSSISLDQLPEIAKHQDVRITRPGHMSDFELDIVMHQKLRGRSALGELVAEYVLDSDVWTLFGRDKQATANVFINWLSGLPHGLDWYLEDQDEDDQALIGYLPVDDEDAWSNEEIAVQLYDNRRNLEVVQLVWGVFGTRLEATVEVTSQTMDDGAEVRFFITMQGNADSNYIQITSILDSVVQPQLNNYMLLIGQRPESAQRNRNNPDNYLYFDVNSSEDEEIIIFGFPAFQQTNLAAGLLDSQLIHSDSQESYQEMRHQMLSSPTQVVLDTKPPHLRWPWDMTVYRVDSMLLDPNLLKKTQRGFLYKGNIPPDLLEVFQYLPGDPTLW